MTSNSANVREVKDTKLWITSISLTAAWISIGVRWPSGDRAWAESLRRLPGQANGNFVDCSEEIIAALMSNRVYHRITRCTGSVYSRFGQGSVVAKHPPRMNHARLPNEGRSIPRISRRTRRRRARIELYLVMPVLLTRMLSVLT